jgi:hypothetical protein
MISRVLVVGAVVMLVGGCDRKEPPAPPPAASVAPPKESAPPAAAADEGSIWSKVSPSPGKLGAALEAEVAKAKAKSLKPVVYLGAGWCKPCVAIKKYRKDPKMLEAFRGTYVAELDIDDWKEEDLKPLGLNDRAVPYFHLVDDRGHSTGTKLSSSAWGEDIPENMAPPLTKFFAPR